MGLDMYAYRVVNPDEPSPIHLIGESDYMPFEGAQVEELFYWRKHPNLHGWMEELYYKKGGREQPFNCVNVVLTKEDIDNLEKDIKARKLPETAGFFFGQSSEEDDEKDLEFVELAKKELESGNVVYYTSWW
jgi:hypothetical protein